MGGLPWGKGWEGVYMLMTGLLSQVMLTAVCCVVFFEPTYLPADLTMTMSEKLRVMLRRQCIGLFKRCSGFYGMVLVRQKIIKK